MRGIIHQINISRGGIPKRPIIEAHVTPDGIEGDSWAHPRYHGGPKQAVLLIALEDLDALKTRGYDVYPGALGENLTVAGIDMRSVRFGDMFRAGQALLQITKLRKPCRTLDSIAGPAARPDGPLSLHSRHSTQLQRSIGIAPVRKLSVDAHRMAIQNHLYDETPGSPLWGRGGFYASVKEPGIIKPGDIIAMAGPDLSPDAWSER
jgi:MOSC domain-containing protein YiiM